MAQVQVNDDGTFSAVVGDTDVTDVTDYEEAGEILDEYEQEGNENEKVESPDIQDSTDDLPVDSAAPAPDEEASLPSTDDFTVDEEVMPLSSTASNAVFTPAVWQVNLAANRGLGEHYLMYAVRRSYGSSSYYWQYYLIRGRDITYANDVYSYHDCDLYTYYSYGSTLTYEYTVGSGSVNGNSSLVYSDLYFDYVGSDPLYISYPYISVTLMLVVVLLLILGVRRRV